MRLTTALVALFTGVSSIQTPPPVSSPEPGNVANPDRGYRTYSGREIQALLDRDGYCKLPPGVHRTDQPIQLVAGQRLEGCGFASRLQYTGKGEWAVIFGKKDEFTAGCYLENLQINGGGVLCERYGQHCAIEKVWVMRAKGDGFRVDGVGERIVFRDVISYGNGGNGFTIRSSKPISGIFFDHCNAQNNQGYGMLFETTAWEGLVSKAVVRDCTVQGNGLRGGVSAEVLLRGYVGQLRMENIWVENIQNRPHSVPAGIRTEASKPFPRPDSDTPGIRRPGRLVIAGNSQIALIPRAIEFADCHECRIEQLSVSPATARIYWRSNPRGEASTYTTPPAGEKWLLNPEQIVADPNLK